jgi:hypothetical protein
MQKKKGTYAVVLRKRHGQRLGLELVLPIGKRQHL